MKLDFNTPIPAVLMSVIFNACAPMQQQSQSLASSGGNESARDAELELAIVSEVNRVRSRAGLESLSRDSKLDLLARRHSRYMVSNQNQLDLGCADISHAGKEGRQVAAYRLYGYEYCDENVASFTVSGGPKQTAESVGQLWKRHPNSKKRVTTSMFNRTGISVIQGSEGHYFATQIFGKKSSYSNELNRRFAGY